MRSRKERKWIYGLIGSTEFISTNVAKPFEKKEKREVLE